VNAAKVAPDAERRDVFGFVAADRGVKGWEGEDEGPGRVKGRDLVRATDCYGAQAGACGVNSSDSEPLALAKVSARRVFGSRRAALLTYCPRTEKPDGFGAGQNANFADGFPNDDQNPTRWACMVGSFALN
jgi:hypothetical protein